MKLTHLLLAPALMAPVAASAQPPSPAAQVAQGDWAYQAVENLAARGLVHGYKDAKFLSGKKLTRIEMASLVKRLLDGIAALQVPANLAPNGTPSTAATRGQGYEAPPTGRRPAVPAEFATVRFANLQESDLPVIRRLANEYSAELAIIGANLGEANQKIDDLEGRVEQIESSLRDPEGPLQTLITSVARIDRLRFSGYVQARYESFENTNEADVAGPQPRIADRFTVRRVRLVAAARPTDKIGVRWQLDGGGPSDSGDTGATVQTRDAWIDYYFTGNPATGLTATIGQMKVPFGFEVVQSSGVREAPERARVARFFFPDERDRGFKIALPTGNKVFAEVGVFNGIGPGGTGTLRGGTNLNDNNNNKNVSGRVRTTLFGRADVGVSFDIGNTLRSGAYYTGEPDAPTAADPREHTKRVFGADAQIFVRDGTVLRLEGMWGTAGGTDASGYIAQLIQNVGKKNQFVVKYDWFNAEDIVAAPVGSAGTPVGTAPYQGTLTNLSFGVVHFLDSSTRLKLFYEMHDRERGRLPGVSGANGIVPWQGNILRFEVISVF